MFNEVELLKDAAKSIGIDLDYNQQDKFIKYLRVLQERNQSINLIGNSEAQEIVWKHFIDSIAIPSNIIKAFSPDPQISLLDIGSGAGFPGIPLKIIIPSIKLSLLEATKKKADFIREVVGILKLENVNIIWGRAEEAAHLQAYREQFEIVVSRALAELNILTELALPFVKQTGLFVAYKGPKIEEELNNAQNSIKQLGGKVEDQISIRINDFERTFVIIRKIDSSPVKYPRRSGIPQKRPL